MKRCTFISVIRKYNGTQWVYDVIYDIKNEIAHIAKNYYPDKEISIEINQKECCKKACWHCKKYLSGKI